MAQPPIRKFYVGKALESVAALNDVLHDLTEHEVMHCIAIEAGSQRRKRILITLVRRAARFNKQQFLKHISEKFHVRIKETDGG